MCNSFDGWQISLLLGRSSVRIEVMAQPHHNDAEIRPATREAKAAEISSTQTIEEPVGQGTQPTNSKRGKNSLRVKILKEFFFACITPFLVFG